MIQNQREFNYVYTARIYYTNQQNVNPNVKNYFTGYPFLRDIKVKAISISNISVTIDLQSYISISDRKNNYSLFNYPTSDLQTNYNRGKLRLFNIDGIDLLNSYWIYTGTPFSFTTGGIIMAINFYY